LINVNQSTPMGTFTSASGLGGSSAVVDVSTTEGDLVIDILVKPGGTLTPDVSQNSRWTASADGNWQGGGSSEVAGITGTTNMAWALTGANAWVLGAAAVKSV
jgi:hypothetical protein